MQELFPFYDPKNLLEESVYGAYIDVIRFVLDHHPELVNHKNSVGDSMLHVSCKRRNIQVMTELITHGADTTVVDLRGNSAESILIAAQNILQLRVYRKLKLTAS